MDKRENMKQQEQYGYTYVVRYKYHEDDDKEYHGYYCCDSYDVPTNEIEEHFEIEEGDEYEIIYEVANDFSSDVYLSDAVIQLLQGDCEIEDEDFAQYYIAYIEVIYNECWYKKDAGDEYKRNVLSSMQKYIDLRKRSPMIKYVADKILDIFAIEKDNNLNVRKQIELILDAQVNENILSQLIQPNYIKSAQRHLDEIGAAYKIAEEKSLYRIGVLFLRVFKAFSQNGFILPKFIKRDGSIRNYTKLMKILANYYGIEPPTYREGKLMNYKEKGEKYTLYSTIKQEHNIVWLRFY